MYVSQSFLVTTVMTTLRSPRGDLAEAQFMARSGDWQHGEVGGQDAGMVSLVTRPPSTLYMAAGARPLGDWCRGAPCRVPVSASPRPDHQPHLAPSVLVTPYYALQLRICIHIVSILSSLTDGEHRTDI